MTAATLATPDHPLAAAFWQFNVAPSRLVHPSRHAALLPLGWQRWWAAGQRASEDAGAAESMRRVLHRHWSAALLQQFQLGVVKTTDDPHLPLALAGPALFDRLLLSVGAALFGPAIRRVILRSEVRAIEAQLGPELMNLLRREAADLWPGKDESQQVSLPPDTAMASRRLGAAVLAAAFEGAPAAIAARAQLRLPAEADLASAELPPALAVPAAALQFGRSILQVLDPQWLSLFPAPR